MTGRHVRVGGWCDRCGGSGRVDVVHVDSPVPEVVLNVLRMVEDRISAQVGARLIELEQARGCEAAAARGFEEGRLQVVSVDMWAAIGVEPGGFAYATVGEDGEIPAKS